MIELIDQVCIMEMIRCNITKKIIQIIEFDTTLVTSYVKNISSVPGSFFNQFVIYIYISASLACAARLADAWCHID